MKAFQNAIALLLGLAMLLFATCAVRSESPPALTGAQRIELDTLKEQLTDPQRDAKTKREAALLLLTRSYPQATALVAAFLADDTNRPAQIAIADGIVQAARSDDDFVKPLMAMLSGAEPTVRTPAANALAAYKDPKVLDGLTKLAADAKGDKAIRLVVIAALQRVLDKKAVDALMGLLNDPDEAVRAAACESLARLTSIRAFDKDIARWQAWWAQNKTKPQSDWLADLADNLARSNITMERENVELRRRLATAMNDLYAATPASARDALLADMLNDPLAEVRLAGAKLAQPRLAGTNAPLSDALRAAVRNRLTDADPGVRRLGALLLVSANDEQAAKLLSERLSAEQSPEVREGLYQALGMLQDGGAWDLLVTGIGQNEKRAAAAAAMAVARVAEKTPTITDERKAAALGALKKAYAVNGDPESAPLREALLTAMGALKDKQVTPLMIEALKDPAATVRLSAVKGLERLGNPEAVKPIAPLTGDGDRGVRLAALSAVGALGSGDDLDTLLARTVAATETDAAVRTQAWTVAMDLLAKADVAALTKMADTLATREDAAEYYIGVLRLWVKKLPPEDADAWRPVRLRLGEALLKANQPAEAARELALVQAALVKANSPQAGAVWLKWIDALLAADDVTAIARIAETTDAKQFAAGVDALWRTLHARRDKKDWDGIVRLAGAAVAKFNGRLDERERADFAAALQEAVAGQQAADRTRVSVLAARVTGADEASKAAAVKELTEMKTRALDPLVGELKTLAKADPPNPAAEKALTDLLATLAPQLKGYDPKAAPADRVKTLDNWLDQLKTAPPATTTAP